MSDDTQPTETQQQVYEWQRQYKTVSLELDQARFEIEALQRKLNEYSNALQECQANADQNKEAVKEMAATLLATTKDCAAMRSALEQLVASCTSAGASTVTCPSRAIRDAAQTALATDAGKGYVPAAEHEKLKAQFAAVRELLAQAKAHCWSHEGWNPHLARCLEVAISSDIGSGYVPADKARVIAEALWKVWIEDEMGYITNGVENECAKCGGLNGSHEDYCCQGMIEPALATAREFGLLEDWK